MNWWALAIIVGIIGIVFTSPFWGGEKHPTSWICNMCNNYMKECECK